MRTPELPEVEAMARLTARLVKGRKILDCRVIHAVVARNSPSFRGAEGEEESAVSLEFREKQIPPGEVRRDSLPVVA